jgi:transposase
VLSHQERKKLSNRQVAAIYDIRNHNHVVVLRRNLDEGGMEALRDRKKGHIDMKPVRRTPGPSGTVTNESAQTLRDENERLRAGVAYLKKLQALIRFKRSAAPTKRV